jgi:hypothetical protein
MEAIQATALRTFGLAQYRNLPKRLIVASDLLQNVPGGLNQYDNASIKFADFEKTAYFNRVRADLSGVQVTSLYLVRTLIPQKWPEHRMFWEQYFQAQGATVDRIEPIFGAK